MLFERSMIVVSMVATLAFAGAGVHAWLVPPGEELSLHVLLGLGSAMLLVFPHLWVVVYLLATGRAVRREVAERELAPPQSAAALARLRRYRTSVLPPLGLAVAGAVATVMIGQPVVTATVEPRVHAGVFLATLAVQLWALWAEGRALSGNARLMAEVDRGLPAPAAAGG